ncbi:MAG: glycosyltransferase, partial [Gammaproteobacteria bacterium]|nr:glycosyltransferase [Gammaproteobacteria bacterium]
MNNNSENNNKICHIISGDLWGGAETQAYSIICELSKMGIYNIDVVIFNDGVLYSRLLKNNFNVHLLAEADKNILRMIYAMYILFKKIKPDVIHAHGFKENLIGGIVAKLLKIKLIRTHHGIGMINGKLVYRLIEIINGRFLTNCIISVSEDLKKLLIKNNICNSGARVIRNGLNCTDASSDINVDELRNELGIDKKAYVIGTMGRMVPVKNHKCLIDGVHKILGENINVYLIIVGDGPLMEQLREYVKLLGIDEKVKLPGFKNDVN